MRSTCVQYLHELEYPHLQNKNVKRTVTVKIEQLCQEISKKHTNQEVFWCQQLMQVPL